MAVKNIYSLDGVAKSCLNNYFTHMEYLFSYGTLRNKCVQIATFGREVKGHEDALIGFRKDWLEITDPHVLATSNQAHHPIAMRTDNPDDRVLGTVFGLSKEDIARADEYEVDDYERVSVVLASGKTAWLYEKKH